MLPYASAMAGGRRPSMADVARAAGVSVMTVSYAFGQPARVSADAAAKVRRAAEQLGYPGPHPGARSLRRGSAGNLGVVLGEHLTYAFEDPQAARFLAGVAQVCADAGVGLVLVPVTGGAEDAVRVQQSAVDGFVVWTTADDDPVLDAVLATGHRSIVHGGTARSGLATLSIDDRAAARAIGLLAFRGAERPAVLSFPLDRSRQQGVVVGPDAGSATFPVTRNRLAGFRDAWEETGGSWSQVQVAVCAVNAGPGGESAVSALLATDMGVDTVAAMSDELALGALQASAAAGRSVPDALAVTGWDDTVAAAPAGLTTVRQDLRAQGVACAQAALGITELPRSEPPWEVVLRSTTRGA